MLTSTFGIVMIVLGGLAALAGMEGVVLYAALRPTWKTGRGASTEGLHEAPAPASTPARDSTVTRRSQVPVAVGR